MLTSSWILVSVIVTLCLICFFQLVKTLVRFIYLTMQIPQPTLQELYRLHFDGFFSDNMLAAMDNLVTSRRHEPFGAWWGWMFAIVVSDSDTMSEVFKNKYLTMKPDSFYAAVGTYQGKGLITLNGEEHTRRRKLMNPGFRKNFLESHLPRIHEDTLELVTMLREKANGETVDVRSLILDYADEVAVSVFSQRERFPRNTGHLLRIANPIMVFAHMKMTNPPYYWFVHKLKKSTRETEAFIKATLAKGKEIVNRGRARAAERLGDNEPSSLLECLVHRDGEKGFTDEQFFGETFTTLAAASDTTAFSANVCLLLLSLHQDVQQRAYEEVVSIFGVNDQPAIGTLEDLGKMVYIDKVIKETLRLFPAGPFIARCVEEETYLNGMLLPKGCIVGLNIFSLHRNPDVFSDPLKFDPERFSPEACQDRPACAFIPFSHGLRSCPGNHIGTMMLKVFIAHILTNFQILPGEGLKSIADIKFKMHITMDLLESSLRFVRRSK